MATLDGDGQNDPADFPAMIARLRDGDVDLVSGIRIDRQDSWLRKFMSRLANRVRGVFLDDGVTDSGCAIKVFRRSVVDSLIPLRTLYSFIPALAKGAGYRIAECPVRHRDRDGGKTHYGLSVFLWRPRSTCSASAGLTGGASMPPEPPGSKRHPARVAAPFC